MSKKNSLLGKVPVLILLLTLLVSGCGQKSQQPAPQPQSAQTEQKPDKVPDQLKSIEDSTEKIISALEGPAVGAKEDDTEAKKKTEEGGQAKDSQSKQGDQSKDGKGAQQGQAAQPAQATQAPKQPDPFEKVAPEINTLHYHWNNYMPLAVKMNASKSLLDNFSNALNNLTNNILTKNKTNSLMAANHLYSYIPDFYSLYKTETSPEIKRLRYYTRNIMLNSMIGNWNQADSDMGSLKASWGLYKNMVPKDLQDNSNKLDLSVYELEKVVKEKSQPLTDIKGKVALSNVEALDKGMENKSKQGK